MAYPQNNNNWKMENWFSRLLARKGADYISSGKLTDGEVVRNLDRIVDDIVYGRIDYSVYGNDILDPKVFNNLLSYCRNKIAILTAQKYSLEYVIWACETGKIIIANTNLTPGMQSMVPQTTPPYDFDIRLLQQGVSTITSNMKHTIAVALKDATVEYNKFNILTTTLEQVQETKNIYLLQWATASLKQYVRSTNRVTY